MFGTLRSMIVFLHLTFEQHGHIIYGLRPIGQQIISTNFGSCKAVNRKSEVIQILSTSGSENLFFVSTTDLILKSTLKINILPPKIAQMESNWKNQSILRI